MGLDLLRAIAILMVLFSHTANLLPFPANINRDLFDFFGYMGVEFFFVLSGYLVGGILFVQFEKFGIHGKSIYHFWIRRWFRTLPAYYLALLVYLGLDYFSLGVRWWEYPFVANYLFFGQNWFQPHPLFFPIAWSLSIEEWFYLLLPFWVMLGYHWWGSNQRKWIRWTGAILLLYPLLRILAGWNGADWDYDIRMRVPLRFDALLMGVFSWLFLKKYVLTAMQKRRLGWMGILLGLGTSAFFFMGKVPYLGGDQFLIRSHYFSLVSLAVALCIPWLSDPQRETGAWWAGIVRFISRISYSLYLSHVFSIYLATTLVNKWVGGPSNGLKWIFSWGLSVLVAALMYRFYEKPMMDIRDRFSLPEPQPIK